MALDLSVLNTPQQRAVTTVRGPVLVLAGAGTGKTRVITFRIAWLLEQGVPAERIAAMTFTNKAAREMRERVRSLVGPAARNLTLSTFHSFCARFLRREIEVFQGYRRNFVIYDENDQTSLLKRIVHQVHAADAAIDVQAVRAEISRAKNAGLGPRAYANRAATDWQGLVIPLYERYQKALRGLNAVDFDDLLVFTARALEKPEIRARYESRYEHLLIDEFQDTNEIQFRIARALAAKSRSICVVGDDDQSIYAWRGAEIANLLEFERWFPKPTVVPLEQNYRSTNGILQAANALIRNNPRRRPKQLWSDLGDGQPVWVLPADGDRDEAERIAALIQAARSRSRARFEDHAVLYRTNAQSRLFEEVFRRERIPYRVVGGMAYYERREVKDALAYLRAVANPSDDLALLRILNVPPRGLGSRAVTTLVEAAKEREVPLHDVLERAEELADTLSPRAVQSVVRFHGLLNACRARLEAAEPLAPVVQRLLEDSGYLAWLRKARDPEEALSRTANVQELVNAVADYERSAVDASLPAFLETVSLAGEDEKEEDQTDDGRGVTLTTIHAAKGLEYLYVHVVGVEQGLLPHQRSLDTGDVGEERRLLYVAMTRAKRGLTLSFCRTRRKYGNETPCWPSSFLGELPPDVVRVAGGAAETLINNPA